jgi:hypothetical protein
MVRTYECVKAFIVKRESNSYKSWLKRIPAGSRWTAEKVLFHRHARLRECGDTGRWLKVSRQCLKTNFRRV